jgi:vancomycin resistance protein VanJ
MPSTPKFTFASTLAQRLARTWSEGLAIHLPQLLSLCFWAALWLFALVMSGNLVLGWLTGDRLLSVRLTHYLLPWLFLLLLVALVPALLSRRGWLALAVAGPALAIGLGYLPVFLPRSQVQPAESLVRLKVMSYNVWSANPSMEPAAAMIREEDPDILLLQEISPRSLRELTQALGEPTSGEGRVWHVSLAPNLMQAVVSRYPVTEQMADRRKAKVQAVRVATPAGEVTVFNVHPLRGDWVRRHRQLQNLLREDVLNAPGPVILGGDFNTTDKSETYRMLSLHLQNAHWDAGWGFGFTYPAYRHAWHEFLPAWPLVRIDHIFHSRDFLAVNARTLKESYGSDHFPVMAALVLEKTPTGELAAVR